MQAKEMKKEIMIQTASLVTAGVALVSVLLMMATV
jgi:hypothetical protein